MAITSLPNTQFSGIDFNNIMTDIVTLVTDNPVYNSNWDDFLSSNAGRMMIELFAYIADQLSIRIDWFANENFISTATQDTSILNLLKLIYYKLSLAECSMVTVDLNLQIPVTTIPLILTPAYTPLSGIRNDIYSLLATDKNGNTKNFEFINRNSVTGVFDYISPVSIIGSVANPVSITSFDVYEGTTKVAIFTSLTNDNPHFQLPDTSVIKNSIVVYQRTSTTEITLMEVDNFLNPKAFDLALNIPYVVNVLDVGVAEIEFAPSSVLADPNRRFPIGGTIEVFYRVGGGSLGNIAIKNINTTKGILDSINTIHPIIFTNNIAGTGGIDAETIEHARLNGPMVTSTSQKTVTIKDYDVILNKFGSVLLSKTYGSINAPSDFYSLYGRNINPQEVWNYVLFNKNYSAVPTSQYNNFKWITTFLENRFNELYSFNYGKFNVVSILPVKKLQPTLQSYTYVTDTNKSTFKNAIPAYVSDDYKNLIINSGVFNTELKIKFSSNQVSTTFFDLIDVSNDYTVQWLKIGTGLGINAMTGTLSTVYTTYNIIINGVNYSFVYGVNGKNSSSIKYSQLANLINTSLNSTYSGTTSNLNDFMIVGQIVASEDYTIVIDSNGTTDTFIWQKNGYFSPSIPISTSVISIDNGAFSIQFAAQTGHTIGNMWAVSCINPAFCSWDISPITSSYDMEFYIPNTSDVLSIKSGSPDLLAFVYPGFLYLEPLITERASINGTGFINGNKTKTGLGYIGSLPVISVDTEDCSAEFSSDTALISGSSIATYGYDISTKKSIGVSVDGRGMLIIPLSTDYTSIDKKLILLSNPSPLGSGYSPGSQDVAKYKYGIVEKVNAAFSSSNYYGSAATSTQWLGIDGVVTHPLAQGDVLPYISPNTYYVNINANNYAVPLGGSGRTGLAYKVIADYINTSLRTTYSGTSLNDFYITGTTSIANPYTVQISSIGSTDILRWKNGAGPWVMLGGLSSISKTSDNGTTWSSPSSLTGWGANTIKTMVTDGTGVIMAGGTGGYFSLSTDFGTSWSIPAVLSGWSGTNNINGIATDGLGNWMVVGDNGCFSLTKNNGITWTTAALVTGWTTSITAVATDGINWIVGGASGKISYITEASLLGIITWTTYTLPSWSTETINSIKSDNNPNNTFSNWVIVGTNAKLSYTVASSLGSWITVAPAGWSGDIKSVTTDGIGNWIIVGVIGQKSTSTDNGANWTHSNIAGFSAGTINSVSTDGVGNWVAVGDTGKAYSAITANIASTAWISISGWSTTNISKVCAASNWHSRTVTTSIVSINNAMNIYFGGITGHTIKDTWIVSNTVPYCCAWAPKKGVNSWDIKFYTAPGNTSTIIVAAGTTSDLLYILYSGTTYAGLVPVAIPAGDYSNIASVVTEPITGNKYLKFTSPSTGINSTIQFIVSDYLSTLDTSIELMDTFGVPFIGNASDFCVGQKKITIISNPLSEYFGSIIYEHNSIAYPSYYSNIIYSHYVAQQKNSIILGSVYNNFYVTGDAIIDALYKNDVYRIYNTNVYLNGIPNVEASDIKLAFTNVPVFTNSIDAIENDSNRIDIYPMEYMKIPSIDLHGISATTFASTDYLMFNIDGLGKLEVQLGSAISSFDLLISTIKLAISSNLAYSGNIVNYLELDASNPYIFWLKSASKNSNSNVTLYRQPPTMNYEDNHALSKIFGSPLLNSSDPVSLMQFGNLYFYDTSFDNATIQNATFNTFNVGFDLAGGMLDTMPSGYANSPTVNHDALPFTYSFIDPLTSIARNPDYYLTYENYNVTYAGPSNNNDLNFSGNIVDTYVITISSIGSPDQFTWNKLSSTVISAPLNTSTINVTINDGVNILNINFDSPIGHGVGDTWTIVPNNYYKMNKTAINRIPDNEFYVHFVNDRTKENVTLDETLLQTYLNEYRLTSVTNKIIQPLFSTFDFAATINYNPTYSLSSIQSSINSLLTSNYSVSNSIVGNNINKSSVVSTIHSVNGVLSITIKYFGKDYTDFTTNQENSMPARFDEIIVLSENILNTDLVQVHGLILDYIAIIQ